MVAPEIVVQSTLPSSSAAPLVRALEVPPGVAVSIHIEAHSAADPTLVCYETVLIGRSDAPLQLQPAAAPAAMAAPDRAATAAPIAAPIPAATAPVVASVIDRSSFQPTTGRRSLRQ